MDDKAFELVRDYIRDNIDRSLHVKHFELFIVQKSKVLQNWKFHICTDIPDGMQYILTYNGDKQEWYLDALKRVENLCIKN